MFDSILQNVSKYITLSESDEQLFLSLLDVKTFPKKTILLHEGEVCQFEAYVNSGCLRTYYINENGFEVVLQFSIEDWWVSDIASFDSQKPSHLFIETLEDVEVLVLSHENKERLLLEIPTFERFFRILLRRNLAATQSRLIQTMAKPAQEKYLDFIKLYPTISQRVAQHYIASYLGISPEFLSKIRSRIYKE
jgi:CRP/FNR family cyclic AMP-dependent transcriptional regulator